MDTLIGKKVSIEKAVKYTISTMERQSIKYIIWTEDNIFEKYSNLGITRSGISTDGSQYMYDKNDNAIAIKGNDIFLYNIIINKDPAETGS